MNATEAALIARLVARLEKTLGYTAEGDIISRLEYAIDVVATKMQPPLQ